MNLARVAIASVASRHAEIGYRPDIDGLRAVAVLSVVIFHADHGWLPGGFVGVDIFFVISGFLISSIILNDLSSGSFSIATFYAKRIRRIFPALVTVLAASWLAGWFMLTADEFKSLGAQIAAGAGFAANIYFWLTSDYFASSSDLLPELHLWSLGVEEQFYVMWPMLLAFASRRRMNTVKLIVLLGIISLVLNILITPHDPVQTFFLPYARLWELLLGALLATAGQPGSMPLNQVKASVGVALIAATLILVDNSASFPGWRAIPPTIGAALLISAGASAWVNRYFLSNRVAVGIGLISYPLYLWHWPLLAFARTAANGEPSLVVRLLLVASSFLLAWATYEFLEKKVRFGSFRRSAVKPLATGAVVILAAGLATVQQGGFVGRFPAVVQFLADYKYPQYTAGYRVGSCFLRPDQGPNDFRSECGAAGGVVLWGDSHAAHFYPGLLKASSERHFPLGQFNAASCPPIIGFKSAGRANCPEINQFGFDQISSLKPRTLVVSADWTKYVDNPDFANLRPTLEKLKAEGVGHIVLIGPVPHWRPSLPKILLDSFNESPSHTVPDRLRTELNDSVAKTDRQMRELAQEMNVEYFSAFESLCSDEGCLTKLGDRHDDLTAWDYGHLTFSGSDYVTRRLMADPSMRSLVDFRAGQ
ncbi:acyltransferase family protein [Rhizobium indigoferae]|uniref:Acyltransferase family protein n=1 Tax=Rhizobium indigoferae TaxID=158891 RepID=A0ABZ0ZAN6_9HYPH|nr:acyltransferase family protein [Rhizobium indigoferae]NNU55083.1 acyltransferase [Rhizobium indigoferae]WQN36652.1 acyltransferase family protein [Rhizobium indigoferae]GLR61150.1 acyltransferase [Rhizobium indigoferae]